MQNHPEESPVAGQVAIVTGAGQGIGRGIALKLARDGYAVLLGDVRVPQAEAVAAEIRAAGGAAISTGMDVTNAADRERAIGMALRELGRLDVLVTTPRSSAPARRLR